MKEDLTRQLEPLQSPIPVRALDVHIMGQVNNKTSLVSMPLLGCHSKYIKCSLLPTPNQPVILEFPWLCLAEPI